jgi:hypothetical protein
MGRHVLPVALALSAWLATAAQASVTYSYVTDQSNYSVNAGGTVTISLFLQETLTNGSTSLIQGDGGLFSVAASIERANGQTGAGFVTTGSSQGNQYGSTVANLAPFGGSAFRLGADSNTSNPGAQTASQAAIGIVSGGNIGTATNVNPDVNGRFLIGTVTISVSSGTTTFHVSNYPPPGVSSGNTITSGVAAFGPLDLDYTNNSDVNPGSATYSGTLDNPFSFTVTAVPEPSSLLLGGVVVCGGAYGVFRRYRGAGRK